MRNARYGKTLTIAFALVSVLMAGALLAQTRPSTAYPESSTAQPMDTAKPVDTTNSSMMLSIDGKVISTNASSLVVETDAGTRLTFNLDNATAQPASLAAGDRVTVRYNTVAGSNHASNITLAAASTVPTTTTTTTTTTVNEPAPATTDANLPKTASPLPLILLVGTLAALVAFGVHLSRERV